jgi:putative SOS response-associated peptidase YedK
MCNDYEQQVARAEYCAIMQALELGIPTQQSERDLPRHQDQRHGTGQARRRKRHGADKSNRCLIPATAFFEFTGKKYPKAKHRFTLTDAPFIAIAGIWREGEGNQPPAFTMLTTEPGPDVSPYHNRQVVVLRPRDWASWIHLTAPESELLQPLPGGSLTAETVRTASD